MKCICPSYKICFPTYKMCLAINFIGCANHLAEICKYHLIKAFHDVFLLFFYCKKRLEYFDLRLFKLCVSESLVFSQNKHSLTHLYELSNLKISSVSWPFNEKKDKKSPQRQLSVFRYLFLGKPSCKKNG